MDVNSSCETPDGFTLGLKVKQIIGAVQYPGSVMKFILEFEGSSVLEILPATLCNERCPVAVIDYYEKNLIWE